MDYETKLVMTAFRWLNWHRKNHRRCGAKTRKGTPCQMRPEMFRKRCRLHGGLSTGPKTAEGRARIAKAQRERWREWRIASSAGGRVKSSESD